MSFATLMDHVCTVYRVPTESESTDSYGDVVGAFVAQGSERLAIGPPRGGLVNYGPGVQPTGTLVGGMRAAADVKRLDVIDVTSGREAPSKWRVMAVAHPRSHTELVLEPYTGNIA